MAQIVSPSFAPRPVAIAPAPRARLLVAFGLAPVLAVLLSAGMVDACAYTQTSLLGLYGVSSTTAA